jgi:predicted transcriptional regulator
VNIFSIRQEDWTLNIELVDYTDSVGYDLGYEYEASMNIKCTGFEATTSTFYFTNRILNELSNNIKTLYKLDENFTFKSDADELKLTFEAFESKVQKGIVLDVQFKEIESDDLLKTNIRLDRETLTYTLKNIEDFFLSFPLKG